VLYGNGDDSCRIMIGHAAILSKVRRWHLARSVSPAEHLLTAEAREMKEMMMTYQEFVGQPLSEIPTPALLIDWTFLKRTCHDERRVQARGHKCRPHGKAHKSPIIAKKQLEYGAQGQCAAKLAKLKCW